LSRPGGNVGGNAIELTTKRLQLLKETSPTGGAMLWNKEDLAMTLRYEASAKPAQSLA
jgi:putative ABC transport system substrate-binding protein